MVKEVTQPWYKVKKYSDTEIRENMNKQKFS
jgi:hypothetical protein